MKFSDFKIHTYKGYVQNNFIIEYNDRLLLLDGLSRPDSEKISGFINNEVGRDISELKLIAVTHCHPDHAGAAVLLRERYSIPISAPHDIDLWYSGIGGATQHLSDTIQTEYMTKIQKPGIKYESLKYDRMLKPDYPLTQNSPLPFFSDWRAVHAPGHTYHNMIFFNEKHRILYLADCVIDAGKKYLPPVPVLFPETMKNTLTTIKELKPELLLFAHSNNSIQPYMDEIIDEAYSRVDMRDSLFIRFFYLLSKFTPEYRKHREKRKTDQIQGKKPL